MRGLSICLSFAIVGLLVLAAFTAERRGEASRTYAEAVLLTAPRLPVYTARTSRDLYQFYRSKGFRGRVLLQFSSFLNFVDIPPDEIIGRIDRFPVILPQAIAAYETRLNYKNFLWVAMQADIVREINYVLPPAVFTEKMGLIDANQRDVASLSKDRIVAHDWGSKKVLAPLAPFFNEPVLLNIDASFFRDEELPGALQEMRTRGQQIDAVTFCLSEDNPDVTDKERERLKRFAGSLGVSGGFGL